MRRHSTLLRFPLLFLFPLPFFLPLTATPVLAQERVTGAVVDQNGGALPRARVRLLRPDNAEAAHGFTDARGLFELIVDSCTGCRIEASLPGFTTATADAGASPARIVLSVGPIPESVVVSATRGEAPVSQIGSAVTVFEAEEIERRGTPTIGELLRSTAGVAVVRGGGIGNLTTMFVRGGESSYNKVLLDGIPLNEPGGTFDFSNVSTHALERVEVVRGAHSALFGTDAMASVVHLVTKRSSAPMLQVAADAGSYDTRRASVTAGTIRGKVDVAAHAARYETDNRVPNNAFRNTTLSGNGGVRLSDNLAARFVARAELGRAGSPGATAFGRPDLDAFYARRLAVGGMTVQHARGVWHQRVTYALSGSYAESTNLLVDPPYTPAFGSHQAPFEFSDFPYDSASDFTRHHASYQLDRRAATGAFEHLWTAALDWDGERARLHNRLARTIVSASRDNVGGALQHQLLARRWALTSGLRVERNESFGTAVAPRVSFAYMARESGTALGDTRLRASAGAGVKEPTVLQSFSPSPAFLGNPDLAPERSRTADVGIEQRLFNGRAKVEITAFYGRYDNIISTRTLSFTPFVSQYFNVGLTHARGTELALDAAPGAGLTLKGGHTFVDSEVTRSTSPFSPVFAEGQPLFRRPRHSGFVEAAWSRGRVLMSLRGTFVGERVDSDFAALVPPLTTNDAYATWDAAATCDVGRRLSLFVHIENLGNAEYMEPLGYPAWRRSARFGIRAQF